MTAYQALRVQVTVFLNTFQNIKLSNSFLLKKYTKRKLRKTLFLLYYRKKAGGESSFSSIYGTPELENVVLCT